MNINGKWYSEPELQAYVNKLLARIDELESKHYVECSQIARYDDELKEAKQLLKLAVKDMKYCLYYYHSRCDVCALLSYTGECPVINDKECGEKCEWRYADEALALIGEGGDTE